MMKERINKAYRYLQSLGKIANQKDLSEKMRYSRPSISKAMNGYDGYLTESFITAFHNCFDNLFNLDWLLTGEGEMLKKDEDAYLNSIAPEPPEHIQYFFDKIDERDKEIKRLNQVLIEKERENGNLRAIISKLETMLQSNSIDSKQTGS